MKPRRTTGGRRLCPASAVARVQLIQQLFTAGLSSSTARHAPPVHRCPPRRCRVVGATAGRARTAGVRGRRSAGGRPPSRRTDRSRRSPRRCVVPGVPRRGSDRWSSARWGTDVEEDVIGRRRRGGPRPRSAGDGTNRQHTSPGRHPTHQPTPTARQTAPCP
ncbi:hypothetical protein [Streptomyces sp. B3I7]|uniref:hypothetical protein n=1 Tax=Streptomyces sp. B3I7 TaxID=3042269 RepID=UPI0027D897A2|nr:hypothetical protein [Streptomyces sp. B3I7]